MRIIDILALISYPLLIIDAILLFFYLARTVAFQIKNKVISWMIIIVFLITIIFSFREFLATITRYMKITGVNSIIVTDWYIIVSFSLVIAFTSLIVLLYTKNTNKFIVFGKNRKGE